MKAIKHTSISIIVLCFILIVFAFKGGEPWKASQLLAPSDLATNLNDTKATHPILISVGEAGLIKGAIQIGAMTEIENVAKLKSLLNKTDKDLEVVVYCGCCPFEHCPNIRPAFELLTSLKFTKHKLLNLPHNIKVDWMDKGYPMK
jgi:thiosulfate/3-mercaptopyruvate sulfurtransferase